MGPKSLRFLLRRFPHLSPLAQAGGRTRQLLAVAPGNVSGVLVSRGAEWIQHPAQSPDAASTSVLQLPISNGAEIHASS